MALVFTAPTLASDTANLDEGTYTVEFTGYDLPLMEGCGYNEPNDPDVCKYERRTKFWFSIVEDGELTGEKLSEYVTLQVKYKGINDPAGWKTLLGEKAKFAKFVKALNGGTAISPGDPVDVDSFIGKRISVVLERNEKGYLKVTAPTAIRQARKKAAAPVATADDPFADED